MEYNLTPILAAVIVLLFWLHDELLLAVFNIPYLIFNMWK